MFFAPVVPYAPQSSFFRTQQGKVAELRQELNGGGKKDKNHSAKKIALKKIVANMTMSNNDMVALFPDIVNCMTIPSLEIKKMYVRVPWGEGITLWRVHSLLISGWNRCFLFLVNYSRIKPEVAMKALPTLVAVWIDPSPKSRQTQLTRYTAGYGRYQSTCSSPSPTNHLIYPRSRIRGSNHSAIEAIAGRLGPIRPQDSVVLCGEAL